MSKRSATSEAPRRSRPNEGQTGDLEGHHQLGFGEVLDREEDRSRIARILAGIRCQYTTIRRQAVDPKEHVVGQDAVGRSAGHQSVKRPPIAPGRPHRLSEFGDTQAEESPAALGIAYLLGFAGQLEDEAKRG